MTSVSLSVPSLFKKVFNFTTLSVQTAAPEQSWLTKSLQPFWSQRRISNASDGDQSGAAAKSDSTPSSPPPSPPNDPPPPSSPPPPPSNDPPPPSSKPPGRKELIERYPRADDRIHQLLRNPALYNPLQKPRYPIVLCHGLYGFDVRGPAYFPRLQMHYWNNVLAILRKRVGAEVIVTSVPSTGSVQERAADLDRALRVKALGRGVNFIAHSMGGLDCRHLISSLKPTEYAPLSLTTVATPHRGSPFMDWCASNIGVGRIQKTTTTTTTTVKKPGQAGEQSEKTTTTKTSTTTSSLTAALAALPASFTSFLLSIVDSPAYSNLSSAYLRDHFNPATPDSPDVQYFSVAARSPATNIWHPLWLPKLVLDQYERSQRELLRQSSPALAEDPAKWGNDGLVTVRSARWGEFLGTMDGVDHWEIRGARGIELDIELPNVFVPFSIPGAGSLKDLDWPDFLRAWRGKEKEQQAAVSIDEEQRTLDSPAKEGEGGKSSAEKLSAVFDWVSEHVHTPTSIRGSGKVESISAGTNRKGERNELATKEDLERFYIALCRNLYDNGL